jgi:hypothetical protein
LTGVNAVMAGGAAACVSAGLDTAVRQPASNSSDIDLVVGSGVIRVFIVPPPY